ncbi:phage tail assembly protein [Symbiopectobacterium purcellii]|nr:phage tail assembly protein [Symbiopectobacterium purcellii]
MEKTKIIPLSKPLDDKTQKTAWEQIELREPALLEVEQFYDKQTKSSSLAAMRLLISLVSGVPESALGRMAFTDYRECEGFLLGFLTYEK